MSQRKKSEERRKEIVLAAVQIIDTDGIHALTLQRIADRLEVSDVALLRHFRSKEEIVETLAQTVFFTTVVTEQFDASMSLRDNLEDLLRKQFAAFEAWPESTAILFQEEIFREYPAIREWFVTRRTERHRKLARMIRLAQDSGLIKKDIDAEVFASVFMGAMRMGVMEWREGGRSASLVAKAEPIMAFLAQALEAKG